MLALAQKINHWALGHYRAATEDHKHLRDDPYLKRRRQYLLLRQIEFQKPIYPSHFQAHQSKSHRTHSSPPFLQIYTAFARMSFIKQKRGSKWNKLSKRSTNQENELTPRDDLGLKSKAWSHWKPQEKKNSSPRGYDPINIGWIFSHFGRSSGHTRNGLSGMVDEARMHSRLKTNTNDTSRTHWGRGT